MKKIIAVLLAAAMMAVIAAGCTGAGESGTPSQNSGTGSESGTCPGKGRVLDEGKGCRKVCPWA